MKSLSEYELINNIIFYRKGTLPNEIIEYLNIQILDNFKIGRYKNFVSKEDWVKIEEWHSKSKKERMRIYSNIKYGTDHPSQNAKVKKRKNETCIDKYGDITPLRNNKIKEKIKKTCLEKYGVDNPGKSDEIKSKIKQTNLSKFGKEYASQSDIIKDKVKKTCLNKYGVSTNLQMKSVVDKVHKNNIKKYGTKCPFSSSIIKERFNDKYGVQYPFQLNSVQNKIKEKNYETILNFEKENHCILFRKLINMYGQSWLKEQGELNYIYYKRYKFLPKSELYKIEKNNFK